MNQLNKLIKYKISGIILTGDMMKKTLLLVLSLFSFISVYALETNSYRIDISNNFNKKSENYFEYEDKEKDLLVTLSIDVDHNNDEIDIDKYALGLLKDNNYLETIKNMFTNYEGTKIEDYSVDVVKIDNHNALKINLSSTNIPLENYSSKVYQQQLVLSSKNYLYHIIITSNNKDELESENILNIIKSFKILDEDITYDNPYTNYYLSIALVIALWIFVFTCILTKKNRKKVKEIRRKK